ncbi:hypothetical protein PVAP13_5NG271440 [Panicum virgatum]|uniref:Uncharacterized protein n=1 Tax=Panicum virgatum TaxID=38727 RepID=A0A8T0RVE6_PANVG|nr:hypothetical protein PVAP13_5NG271440 [Panicum virgatum]
MAMAYSGLHLAWCPQVAAYCRPSGATGQWRGRDRVIPVQAATVDAPWPTIAWLASCLLFRCCALLGIIVSWSHSVKMDQIASEILLAFFVLKHAKSFVKSSVTTGGVLQFYFNQMN